MPNIGKQECSLYRELPKTFFIPLQPVPSTPCHPVSTPTALARVFEPGPTSHQHLSVDLSVLSLRMEPVCCPQTISCFLHSTKTIWVQGIYSCPNIYEKSGVGIMTVGKPNSAQKQGKTRPSNFDFDGFFRNESGEGFRGGARRLTAKIWREY